MPFKKKNPAEEEAIPQETPETPEIQEEEQEEELPMAA